MYTIIAITAFSVLLTISSLYKSQGIRSHEWLKYILFSGTFGLVAGFVFTVVLSAIFRVPNHDVVSNPATLVSLRSQGTQTGTFIFGTSSLNDKIEYHIMIKNGETLIPYSVPSDENVVFVEDPALTNVGYWRTTKRMVNTKHWFYNWTIFHSTDFVIVRQEFRVPVGTISQKFDVK
jgi:hypothetical protein